MADEKTGLEFIDEISEVDFEIDGLSDEEKSNLSNDGHIDFVDQAPKPKNDSDKKDQSEKKETSSKESNPKESDDPNKTGLQDELEKAEKRRKDTERAYQQERQARLKLEKELEEAKKQKESSQNNQDEIDNKDDDDLLFSVDDPDEEKAAEVQNDAAAKSDDSVKAELNEVKQKQEEMERKQALDAWERASEKIKEKHPDFDEVVYENFYKAFESSPKVKEEFLKKGSTPEAAYELGLEIKRYNDAIDGKNKSKKTDDTERIDKEDSDNIFDPSNALGGNSSGSSKSKRSSSLNDVSDAVQQALAAL